MGALPRLGQGLEELNHRLDLDWESDITRVLFPLSVEVFFSLLALLFLIHCFLTATRSSLHINSTWQNPCHQ